SNFSLDTADDFIDGLVELPRVRTELFQLLVIPPLAPHPEQPHRQLACHSYFGNRMIAAQRQVRVLVSPLLLRTSHALRRLPQQEPKQRIALLTDVAQPPAVGTKRGSF